MYIVDDTVHCYIGASSEETIYGLKSSDIPDASPNVVRMDLAGGFALQKLSSDRCYFR